MKFVIRQFHFLDYHLFLTSRRSLNRSRKELNIECRRPRAEKISGTRGKLIIPSRYIVALGATFCRAF